ncbi:endonuclease I, partial [Pseudomonas sp. CrR25]|nr:endonuclease I [Pseudomonas sp. CrR25]
MRAVVFALGCLAAACSLTTLASGQDRISDPETSEQLFWSQLYGSGGTSLYCGKPFASADALLTVSPVYSGQQLKRALRCVTDRQCSIMNPRYPSIAADLHNLYPALTRIELARRNAQFAELGDDVPNKFGDIGCTLQTSFQQVEPRDEAKGNIARALFYM